MNKVPGAFTNPAYILLCLAAGVVGYSVAFSSGQLFRDGLFQFMTSFSLALTWGLFGLVAGGLKSLAIWAILGAICGSLWAYYTEHLLRKDELARIGAQLPARA